MGDWDFMEISWKFHGGLLGKTSVLHIPICAMDTMAISAMLAP